MTRLSRSMGVSIAVSRHCTDGRAHRWLKDRIPVPVAPINTLTFLRSVSSLLSLSYPEDNFGLMSDYRCPCALYILLGLHLTIS